MVLCHLIAAHTNKIISFVKRSKINVHIFVACSTTVNLFFLLTYGGEECPPVIMHRAVMNENVN